MGEAILSLRLHVHVVVVDKDNFRLVTHTSRTRLSRTKRRPSVGGGLTFCNASLRLLGEGGLRHTTSGGSE